MCAKHRGSWFATALPLIGLIAILRILAVVDSKGSRLHWWYMWLGFLLICKSKSCIDWGQGNHKQNLCPNIAIIVIKALQKTDHILKLFQFLYCLA